MKRAYEKILKTHLGLFPCAALVGVRQCGKTTLLHVLPEGWKIHNDNLKFPRLGGLKFPTPR